MVFPEEQNCCGIPAFYSGDTETGVYLAKQSVQAFSEAHVDYVLSICPTCTMGVKRDFVERLVDDPEWAAKALSISEKTMDASAFLENVLGASAALQGIMAGERLPTMIHVTSSAAIMSGVSPGHCSRPPDIQLEEMKNSDRCCGFGGTYSFLSHPQISKQITGDKIETIKKTGVKTVAMDCPGCMIMLKGGMGKADPSIRCAHTMELLAEALEK